MNGSPLCNHFTRFNPETACTVCLSTGWLWNKRIILVLPFHMVQPGDSLQYHLMFWRIEAQTIQVQSFRSIILFYGMKGRRSSSDLSLPSFKSGSIWDWRDEDSLLLLYCDGRMWPSPAPLLKPRYFTVTISHNHIKLSTEQGECC